MGQKFRFINALTRKKTNRLGLEPSDTIPTHKFLRYYVLHFFTRFPDYRPPQIPNIIRNQPRRAMRLLLCHRKTLVCYWVIQNDKKWIVCWLRIRPNESRFRIWFRTSAKSVYIRLCNPPFISQLLKCIPRKNPFWTGCHAIPLLSNNGTSTIFRFLDPDNGRILSVYWNRFLSRR